MECVCITNIDTKSQRPGVTQKTTLCRREQEKNLDDFEFGGEFLETQSPKKKKKLTLSFIETEN